MEAMVVVAIIAISAALAAPAISRAMAIRRANGAANDLVRIGAMGRSESIAYGRAHLLRYTNFSSGGANGQVQLWRGRIDRCAANDWIAIMDASCATDIDCIQQVDMGIYDMPTHDVRIRIPGAGTADICFQPNGEVMVAPNGGLFGTAPLGGGSNGVRFTVQRRENGGNVGVQRVVVFPFDGTPRQVR